MTDFNQPARKIHEGRNVKRFREMLGIKQEALAVQLNEDWTQVNISRLEQKETIDDALLQQIAEVLKIPVEAFRNFDEEQVLNIITNSSFDNGSVAINHYPTFNPIDKLIELYERMLQQQKELIEKLERLVEKK